MGGVEWIAVLIRRLGGSASLKALCKSTGAAKTVIVKSLKEAEAAGVVCLNDHEYVLVDDHDEHYLPNRAG